MAGSSIVRSFQPTLTAVRREPKRSARALRRLAAAVRGQRIAERWSEGQEDSSRGLIGQEVANPLSGYFAAHTNGPGIWKWTHYFDVYHRHFQKFIGQEVHIVEVGIYSGGSLEMWKDYFGPNCHVYGIDIQPDCQAYAGERVQVFIGDQADRQFWRDFKRQVPRVDIVIDDGGHRPVQQIVTLEEMLPHIRRNGVYLCEDVHGVDNDFMAYVCGLANALNFQEPVPGDTLASRTSTLQRSIASVHFYPFLTVLEKTASPVDHLMAPKHGTEWEPFLS